MSNPITLESSLGGARLMFRMMGKDANKKFRFVLKDVTNRGQTRARTQVQKDFDTRSSSTSKWVELGIRNTSLVKSDLKAIIYVDNTHNKKSRAFLKDQEAGTQRRPMSSDFIARPSKRVPRTGIGRVSAKWKPKAWFGKKKYIDGYGVFKQGRTLRRRPRGGGRVRLMYSLLKSVRLKPRFNYYKAIERGLAKDLEMSLTREINTTFERMAQKYLGPVSKVI